MSNLRHLALCRARSASVSVGFRVMFDNFLRHRPDDHPDHRSALAGADIG